MNLFVTASICVWFFGRLVWASRTKSWSAWCSGNPKFWPGHTHPLCPSIPRNCTIVIIEWLKNYLYEGILTLLISISTALKLYLTQFFVYKIKKTLNQSISFGKVHAHEYWDKTLWTGRPPRKSSERLPQAQNFTSDDRGASQLIACARNLRCGTKIDVKTWAQRILIVGLRRTSWCPLRTTSPSWYGCTWLTVMINNDYGENGKFCNLYLYLRQTDTS